MTKFNKELFQTNLIPVELVDNQFHCSFFENKKIIVDVVNNYNFLITFIIETDLGIIKYSYIDESFKKSDNYNLFNIGKYEFSQFKNDISYVIHDCILSYFDEDNFIHFINVFGNYNLIEDKSCIKHFRFDNICFHYIRSVCNGFYKSFSVRCTKTNDLHINYEISLNNIFIQNNEYLKDKFKDVFKFVKYFYDSHFFISQSIINDDFMVTFFHQNDFVSLHYIDGLLKIIGTDLYCDGNRTSDNNEIEKILFTIIRKAVQYKPTKHFKNLIVHSDFELYELTNEQFQILQMLDL